MLQEIDSVLSLVDRKLSRLSKSKRRADNVYLDNKYSATGERMITLRQLTTLASTLSLIALSSSSHGAPSGEYQGWLWETGVTKSSPSNLTEEYCFGRIDISIAVDLNWDATVTDEVCWGRTTTNSGRILNNFDGSTLSFFSTENSADQSTRPLVSAGGNLKEIFGEELIMGVGQGEYRPATLMSTPSDDSLIVVSGYEQFIDAGEEEALGFVDIFVKSTPAIRDARVTADLVGTTWHSGIVLRSLGRNNADGNVEVAAATVTSFSLLADGICTFTQSSAFPDSPNNRPWYVAAHFDGNDNLGNRGLQIAIEENIASECTYEIDNDKYLALTFTSSNADPMNPDPQVLTARSVVSDDGRYLVYAPSAAGVDDDLVLQRISYRAASAVAPGLIDGTYLFNLVISEYEATGTFSSTGNVGPQEFDEMGRGKFVFHSTTPGTVPQGETGNWFSCDVELVLNEYEIEYSGSFSTNSVAAATDTFADNLALTSCDYRLEPDGSLSMFVTNVEPGDPDSFEAMFRGYVNDNGELMTLVYGEGDPDLIDDQALEDEGSIFFFVAMEYTGDPNGDEDGDGITNLQEFQLPLPPVTQQMIFSYTFEGRSQQPFSNGAVLTGEIVGIVDPADPSGDTVIIDSFDRVTLFRPGLAPFEFQSIESDEFNSIPSGNPAVMSFSGLTMNFRACHNGFTTDSGAGFPDDCPFALEGGFGISYNINPPGGWASAADGSGDTPQCSGVGVRGCRVTDTPFATWRSRARVTLTATALPMRWTRFQMTHENGWIPTTMVLAIMLIQMMMVTPCRMTTKSRTD